MSIQTDLTRIKNAKAAIKAAIEGKGVAVPDTTLLDGMAALIEAIESGGGGGGMQYETGEFTPAEDISLNNSPHVDIGFSASFAARTIVIFAKKASAKAYAFAGCALSYGDGYIGIGYSSSYSFISAGYGSSTSSSATRGNFGISTGTGNFVPDQENGVPIMRHYSTSTMPAGITYKWFACERSLLYT